MLTYTFSQLKAAAAHALGGNPDSRISKGLIVNRALNHLVNAHPWPWRVVLATLDYTADVNTIDLPADFGEILQVRGKEAKYSAIRQLDVASFLNLRNFGVTDTLYLGYILTIKAQSPTTAAPLWQLQVSPTPSATLAQALYLLYRKLLPVFITDDSLTTDDAKVAPLPAGQHDTLYALVRAFAVSMEENPQTPEWQLAGQLLARDIAMASRAENPVLGPMAGCGSNEWLGDGGNYFRPFNSIRTEDLT